MRRAAYSRSHRMRGPNRTFLGGSQRPRSRVRALVQVVRVAVSCGPPMASTPDHELLGEGRWLRLLSRGHWEYVTRTRGRLAAAIVALTDDDRIVLVEQARIPVDARTIELPAGLIGDQDASEAPELAARRELLEETGFCARELREVARGPSSAGLADEQIVMYLATGLERVADGGGDESEDITVHCIPLADVETWLVERVAEGKLVDLKVWGGLHFARNRQSQS